MKKTFRQMTASLIISSILLCGCSSNSLLTSAAAQDLYDHRYSVGSSSIEANTEFDDFTREIFTQSISTDALTLHFELQDPSAYDIDLDNINLGRIDLQNPISTFVSDISTSALQSELHDFDYNSLDKKQQQTYDILMNFLTQTRCMTPGNSFIIPSI